MALVKYGAIITDMKGRIGGTVFKGSKSGPVIQNKTIRGPRGGAYPLIDSATGDPVPSAKAALTSAARSWSSLSDPERAAWVAAAPTFPFINKYGIPYTPSGYQLYVSCALVSLSTGQAVITAPPSPDPIEPNIVISDGAGAAGTLSIAFAPAIPAGYSIQIFASAPSSKGRSAAGAIMKQIFQGDTTTTSPLDLSSAYADVFGLLPASGVPVFLGGKISKADAGRANPLSAPIAVPVA